MCLTKENYLEYKHYVIIMYVYTNLKTNYCIFLLV